jgi:hypothetical protein
MGIVSRAHEAAAVARMPRDGLGRIGTAGPAVVRTRGSASWRPAMGQGGPVASGAARSEYGSTGGSPMKKPST